MMGDANIVTLCKNRRGRRDCNNYQGISLLSIAMKLFARVVLKASLQWPQALPLVVKPSFWEPLSSLPSLIFFDPVFFPFSSKAIQVYTIISLQQSNLQSVVGELFTSRCPSMRAAVFALNYLNGWFKGSNFFNNLTYN